MGRKESFIRGFEKRASKKPPLGVRLKLKAGRLGMLAAVPAAAVGYGLYKAQQRHDNTLIPRNRAQGYY